MRKLLFLIFIIGIQAQMRCLDGYFGIGSRCLPYSAIGGPCVDSPAQCFGIATCVDGICQGDCPIDTINVDGICYAYSELGWG